MSGSSFQGEEAFKALNKLGKSEGWLLSLKIAAHGVKLICDFADFNSRLDGEKTLTFGGVKGLSLSYNQPVFDTGEDDISDILVMKFRDDGPAQSGSSHISFEFSYGTLQFDFEDIEIYDRTDANIPR